MVDVRSNDTSNPMSGSSGGGGLGNGKVITFTNGVAGWQVAAVAACAHWVWLTRKG
jgi:hypothetical protein